MDILFYHSKPEHDPCGRGKRMTVCGLVDNNKILFGIAKTNHRDTFVKRIGRNVSEGRAVKNALVVVEAPVGTDEKDTHKQVRKAFIEKAKSLVKELLRSLKEIEMIKKMQEAEELNRVHQIERINKLKRGKVVNLAIVHVETIDEQPSAASLHDQ